MRERENEKERPMRWKLAANARTELSLDNGSRAPSKINNPAESTVPHFPKETKPRALWDCWQTKINASPAGRNPTSLRREKNCAELEWNRREKEEKDWALLAICMSRRILAPLTLYIYLRILLVEKTNRFFLNYLNYVEITLIMEFILFIGCCYSVNVWF
jgi:hypothetical protein